MNKLFQKDILLIILLALISLACLSIKGSSKYIEVVIPYVILMFFLPGYAIFKAAYPKKTGYIAKIIVGIVLSVIIMVLLTSTTNPNKIHIKSLLQTLVEITLFFAAIAYIRVVMGLKWPKNRYIMCKSCGGYYKLTDEESLDDFGACTCGGELKYAPKYFKSGK
jgi:uncharacterized membrane protein